MVLPFQVDLLNMYDSPWFTYNSDPYHPCMVYLLTLTINLSLSVGKYASPMDAMGNNFHSSSKWQTDAAL